MGPQPVAVEALAALTGASPVTIRRDLTELAGQGLVRRVHGGAVAVDLRGTPLPYELRAAENAAGKAAIAEAVAGLVDDDMAVVIDNGSTMVAVAHALVPRRITALCLSLRAATALSDSTTATIATPGGSVHGVGLRYGGAACLAALDSYRSDVAVLGACSATPAHGLTVTTSEDAQVKRACMASAARVVLAVTGDKLERTSSFRFGAVEDLDDLVTTPDAPEQLLEDFRDAGVRVHLTPA